MLQEADWQRFCPSSCRTQSACQQIRVLVLLCIEEFSHAAVFKGTVARYCTSEDTLMVRDILVIRSCGRFVLIYYFLAFQQTLSILGTQGRIRILCMPLELWIVRTRAECEINPGSKPVCLPLNTSVWCPVWEESQRPHLNVTFSALEI